MANRDVLAIGTSAGGVEALLFLAKHLPRDFPASVLVTIHLPRNSRSVLDQILTGAGNMTATFACDGDLLRKGHVFIAPPDRHLIVESDQIRLGLGPRENNARPSIDAMLRSAAICCASRTVGVVLTGTLGDGASGLWALNACGGVTVVQDPADATFAEMPLNAMRQSQPDHVVRLKEMPKLLTSLVHQPAGEMRPVPERLKFEVEVAKVGHSEVNDMDRIGRRSVLACPDCHGVMWEIDEGDLVRFRCHVGHTYTAELMSIALDESLRRALASAARALDERAALARKLQAQAEEKGTSLVAENWKQRAQEFEHELGILRRSIRKVEMLTASEAMKDAV